MITVGLVPNREKPNTGLVLSKIKRFFESHQIELKEFKGRLSNLTAGCSLAAELNGWREIVDLVMVVGGDGTILRVARDLCSWQVPILGINLGQRGFLAAIEVESLERYLQDIVEGQYSFDQRMMIEACVERKDRVLARYQALNDIVVSRGPFSRIIRLDTYIDGNFLESYRGDGVIVATPTGSTGYSLSAGGPIVNPDLELLVVTPICPHSLYNRAVIATGKEKIFMRVSSRQSPVVLTVDGQEGFSLEDNDRVIVSGGREKVRLVTFSGHSFYKILHQKLKG